LQAPMPSKHDVYRGATTQNIPIKKIKIYKAAKIIATYKLGITVLRSAQSIAVTINGVKIHLLLGQ
jgi:hypothetical protein